MNIPPAMEMPVRGNEYIRRALDHLKIQARRMRQLTATGRIPGGYSRKKLGLYHGARNSGWSTINMILPYSINIESGLHELEDSLGQ
jgi:hypothetical protein